MLYFLRAAGRTFSQGSSMLTRNDLKISPSLRAEDGAEGGSGPVLAVDISRGGFRLLRGMLLGVGVGPERSRSEGTRVDVVE